MSSSSGPLSPCLANSSTQILVDDTDPRIVYSAGWVKAGKPGLECEGTTHGTNYIPGATATFTFEGVGVQVFGTVGLPDGSPTSTYQVDNAVPLTFIFNANGMNNYRVPFYSSPALDPGTHTIVMTSIGNDTTQIFLDYIFYNPMPSSSSTSSLISTGSAEDPGISYGTSLEIASFRARFERNPCPNIASFEAKKFCPCPPIASFEPAHQRRTKNFDL